MTKHRYEYQIIFGDTDQMGVVYYANYLRFFEGARASYWRALGRTYKDLEDAQVAMPVIEAHCTYKRPARYEDLIAVDVSVTEMRGASLRFSYEVRCGNVLLAEGFTRHAVIGPNGRPRAIPEFMRQLVGPTAS
jgi:acyl-CoA thioester hydrolase